MYPGSPWNGFPARGYETARRMAANVPAQFGQLWITATDVRHIRDRNKHDLMQIESPADLRSIVRENPFRPLATADDLPGGWCVTINGDARRLHAAVETVYPGVLGSSHHTREFGIDPLAWQAVIARQTGQYTALYDMSPSQHRRVMDSVCKHCVQAPLWADEATPDKGLLCREPCNVWLSEAVKTREDSE
jgi:hypothetical protein